MGRGMAMNLLAHGAELTVYGRSPQKLEPFAAKGAAVTTELSRAAKADVVFLCLPDTAVVEDVIFGGGGLAQHMGPGQTIVDFSTINYKAAVRIAERLGRKGIAFLDAPVSGMKKRADDGTLTIMCGGEEPVFESVRPYLCYMGQTVLYMGKSGSGQLAKLVNQLLYDINCAALAEILPFAVKMGLDSRQIGEVVNSGTGRSYASEFFIPRDLEGSFEEGYPLEKAYKDLVSAAEISAEEGIPLPVLAAATATYQTALRQGIGKEGKGAMIKVFERILDVEFRG